MDDSTGSAVLAAVGADLARLWEDGGQAPRRWTWRRRKGRCATACWRSGRGCWRRGWRRGARARLARAAPVRCGGEAACEGYRPKGVQTVVGWITMRRAYYACPACGHGQCPLDAALGLGRDSLSPGVRRLACRFGALLPFAEAARRAWPRRRAVQLSASTVRTVTEAVGARREQARGGGDRRGLGAGAATGARRRRRTRLYVAMDGVRILGTDGGGREVKVGVVVPVRAAPPAASGGNRPATPPDWNRRPPSGRAWRWRRIAAGWKGPGRSPCWGMGPSGSGSWPPSTSRTPLQIVDWFHASERIWALGRALYGERDGRDHGLGGAAVGPLGAGPGGDLGRASGRRCPVAARRRRCAMRR